MSKCGIGICFVAALGITTPAMAVIVAGASGGGNTANNTTAAQYLAETGTALDVYDHVVQVGGGTGTYLGYNPSTKDVWILTARHINMGFAGNVTIQGQSYALQDYTDVDGDVRVARYKRPDNAVPTLAAMQLSNTIPTALTDLVMVGFGKNRVENATIDASIPDSTATTSGQGYHPQATRVKRWGTNQVEDLGGGATLALLNVGAYDTIAFATVFDSPGADEWIISNEAHGSVGDSGGPAFVRRDGAWELAGIMTAVTANTEFTFGDETYATEISVYEPMIQLAIGATLIPEPSSAAILGLVALAAFKRRR